MSMMRRTAQLLIGLWLFGASIAMLLRAGLGLDPWDVLHQGLAKESGLSIGLVVVLASVVVMALWIPLRQRPGIGTIANVVLVGVSLEATLAVLPTPTHLAWQITFLLTAVVGNAVATGLYIGARLGPGPRDGLMTGLAAHGVSIRVARTGIEAGVLAAGWLLGGQVGFGTVVFAVAIGPLVHVFMPLFTNPESEGEHCEARRDRRQYPSRKGRTDYRPLVHRADQT